MSPLCQRVDLNKDSNKKLENQMFNLFLLYQFEIVVEFQNNGFFVLVGKER